MSVTYGFYDSYNGDRVYNADQFSSFYDGLINDGVYSSVGQRFYVAASSGMDITVDTVKDLLNVDKGLWTAEVEDIQKFYDRFDRLPETLKTELEALSDRIEKM